MSRKMPRYAGSFNAVAIQRGYKMANEPAVCGLKRSRMCLSRSAYGARVMAWDEEE